LFLVSTWATGQEAGRTQSSAAGNRINSLNELSASLEGLSSRVGKAVVQIFSSGYVLRGEGETGTSAAVVTRQRATGSGMVLSADGYILTNGHVVSNARRVRVRLAAEGPGTAARNAAPSRASTMQPAGKMLEAKIVGIDRDTDVAVLKIDGQRLPYLELGDS